MKLNLAQLRRVSALSEKDPETLATMVVELEGQLDIARALTSEIQKDLTKMLDTGRARMTTRKFNAFKQ